MRNSSAERSHSASRRRCVSGQNPSIEDVERYCLSDCGATAALYRSLKTFYGPPDSELRHRLNFL
jgi:hypothetical protein